MKGTLDYLICSQMCSQRLSLQMGLQRSKVEGRWICNRIEKPMGRTMHRYTGCLTVAGIPSSLTLSQQSGELRTIDVLFSCLCLQFNTFRDRLYAEETEVLPFGGIQVADFFPFKHLAISIILRHVCEDSVSKSLLLSVL